MLRGLIKTGTACAFHWTGANWLIASASGRRHLPLIVGYHRVVEDFRFHLRNSIPAMLISSKMLERHLDWIGRLYRIMSLDEIGESMASGRPFEKPVAAITFDDGYADVFHNAFPILKRKGIPAAVFAVTGLTGSRECLLHDRLYLLFSKACAGNGSYGPLLNLLLRRGVPLHEILLGRNLPRDPQAIMALMLDSLSQEEVRNVVAALESEIEIGEENLEGLQLLTWEMLREMQQAGMTIGSHSRLHALLTNESRKKIRDETAESRTDLERELGAPIRHFAYPDGRFNRGAVEEVHASGYSFAYTTCWHRDRRRPLLTIPRRILWENSCLNAYGRFSPAVMSCQVDGIFDFASGCGSRHSSSGVSDSPNNHRLAHKADEYYGNTPRSRLQAKLYEVGAVDRRNAKAPGNPIAHRSYRSTHR